jgi:hypothetical protein
MQFQRKTCVLLVASCLAAIAQQGVDVRNQYERAYAIVPVVGKGTWDDPKRPMFAPIPSQMKPGDRAGIMAFHHELSDDGRMALVEIVFLNRASLVPALNALAAQPSVQAFQKGRDKPADIEKAFQAVKKDFRLEKFMVRVP